MKHKKLSKSSLLLKLGAFLLGCIFLLVVGIMALLEVYAQKIYNSNPAKKEAAIMMPFAEQYNLEKIYEQNTPSGVDNAHPWFHYTYMGNQAIDELHQELKSYLERNGYIMQEVFYIYDPQCNGNLTGTNCPLGPIRGDIENKGKPYWIIEGQNKERVKVYADISSETYDSHNPNTYGEQKVPSGKSIITITFVVYK